MKKKKLKEELLVLLIKCIFIYILFSLFDYSIALSILITIWIVTFILIVIFEVYIDKKNLKLIKKYIDTNKLDTVGEYNYWNRENLLLTDKYIFIIDKKIIIYTYEDINKIESECSFLRRDKGSFYYRKIFFNDGYTISFQDNNYFLNNKESDFINYMKNKNQKIIIEDIKFKIK